MIWNKLKNIAKRIFGKPDKKKYLDKRVENLETQRLENVSLPFRIIDLKNTGFVVKVSGLYAFISFNHMPWKYSKIDYWTSIAPVLINKIFYCKIHSISKEPLLSIVVNGKIPQFKKTELLIGETYRGIIIEKVRSGIIIDIGYHFDWRCGSFVGFMHQSLFNSLQLFSDCSVGDEIEIMYQGLNEKEWLLFFQNHEIFDWINGIPQALLGQIVSAQVVREEDNKRTKLLVNGKYTGKIIYELENKQTNKMIKNNLKNGEIIHCEVIGFKETERILKLKWISELDGKIIEIKEVKKKTHIYCREVNNFRNDSIQKLMTIRDKIESEM